VERLAARLRAFGRVEARIIPGADHFFTGKLDLLEEALREGLAALDGA
jgi:alpha/beta superfamily hydrolase